MPTTLDYLLTQTKDAGTHLIGEGHVDEGIAVDALREEVARLNKLVSDGKPVCPHCKTAMTPTQYKGYYDTFYYWGCQCETLPGAEVEHGAFG